MLIHILCSRHFPRCFTLPHPYFSQTNHGSLVFHQKPEIDVKSDRFHFKGKGEEEQKEYEADIEFYGPVDVEVNVA